MIAVLVLLGCAHPKLPVALPPRPAPVPRTMPVRPPLPAVWPTPSRADLPPNVIVVVIDDMGADKQAAYGLNAHPSPTPTLDALAARSVVFDHTWVMPGCTPTRSAALTGRMPARTGAGTPEPMGEPGWELPLDELTIPEMLRSAPDPWSSAAVGKWHLSDYPSVDNIHHAVRQGFGSWSGTLGNSASGAGGQMDTEDGPNGYYHHEYVDVSGELRWSDEYATTETTDDALSAMSGLQPPFFAYIAYNAVHTPLEPPPTSLWSGPIGEPRSPDRYDAVAGAFDAEFARLLAGIPADVLARSVLVVFGDNGTPGHAIRLPSVPAHGKMTLFEGGVRVPLYISGPGIAAPAHTAALTHIVDLLPTVAEIAGIDVSKLVNEDGKPVELDGHSLVPWLREPSAPGPELVYTEYHHPNGPPPWNWYRQAARDAQFKLIVDESGEHLYDLGRGSDDGPDLLAGAPLGPDAAASLARLRAEIARHRVEYGYSSSGGVPPAP